MQALDKNNSTQNDSPAGEFLQSEEWRKFQESVGRKTFHLSGENFWANIILHTLPVAGKYFYIPRGPIFNFQFSIFNQDQISKGQISKQTQILNQVQDDIDELINLAKDNRAGWIRIEPENEEALERIKTQTSNVHYGHLMSRGVSITKAPHDVQPKEVFVIDISRSEEELLAEMKPKTRYNIRLAEKKEVRIKKQEVGGECVEDFLRLTDVMAKRQGITAHPEEYYRKMLQNISGDILKLYVAEYEGKVIATNLVVFYGETCIYLHGASDDAFRNVMAPYLLQWQQIRDAKKAGCVRYDFGGVKTCNMQHETYNKNSWEGITKFKTGFSPQTLPTIFPGSYDIIISPKKYWLYRTIQKLKTISRF